MCVGGLLLVADAYGGVWVGVIWVCVCVGVVWECVGVILVRVRLGVGVVLSVHPCVRMWLRGCMSELVRVCATVRARGCVFFVCISEWRSFHFLFTTVASIMHSATDQRDPTTDADALVHGACISVRGERCCIHDLYTIMNACRL